VINFPRPYESPLIPGRIVHSGFFMCSMLTADREVQRILLELLNQMDGFDQTVNVKVSYKMTPIVVV